MSKNKNRENNSQNSLVSGSTQNNSTPKMAQNTSENALITSSEELSPDKVPLDFAKVESLLAQARIPFMPVGHEGEVVTWEDVRDHVIRTIGNTLDVPDLHRASYGLPPSEKDDIRQSFYKWLLY